jgi:hypothetical protein
MQLFFRGEHLFDLVLTKVVSGTPHVTVYLVYLVL